MGDAGRARLGLLLGSVLLLVLVGGAAALTFGQGGEPRDEEVDGDRQDRSRVARKRTRNANDGEDDWLSRVVPPVGVIRSSVTTTLVSGMFPVLVTVIV